MERCRAAVLLLLCLLLLPSCVVVGSGGGGNAGGGTAQGPAPQEPPVGGEGAPAEERIAREIFDRVNDERAARDLAPLEWNDALADIAGEWSEEMARRGTLEHQDIGALMREDDRLSGFQGVGENIFTATGSVPAGTAHAGWMRSDGHRVNVVNPGWDRLGVGVHCAEDGSVWATQQFGRTDGADLPAVAQEVPPEEPLVRPEQDGPRCA